MVKARISQSQTSRYRSQGPITYYQPKSNLSVSIAKTYNLLPLYRYTIIPRLRITSPVVSLSGISAPSDSFHLHDVVSPFLRLSTCLAANLTTSLIFVFALISRHGILSFNFAFNIFLSIALCAVLSLWVVALVNDHVWHP